MAWGFRAGLKRWRGRVAPIAAKSLHEFLDAYFASAERKMRDSGGRK